MPEITINYPDGYNDYPDFVDHVTKVDAQWLNGTGFAFHSISYTLGLNPEGTFSTVRARLDDMESRIPPPGVEFMPKSGGTFTGHVGFNYYRAEYAYLHSIGSLNFKDEAVKVESIKDEDKLSSDSDKALATQQSIKKYVDNRWEKIYDNLLTSPATTINISTWDNGESVDGNNDELYRIIVYWKSGYDGESGVLLRPNNDSALNYGHRQTENRGASVTPEVDENTDAMWILWCNALGLINYTDGVLYASTGNTRILSNHSFWEVNGKVIGAVMTGAFAWDNTVDNITSLVFTASQTNGLAAGTHIIIFRSKC